MASTSAWLNDKGETVGEVFDRGGRWPAMARLWVLMAILLVALIGAVGFEVRIIPLLTPNKLSSVLPLQSAAKADNSPSISSSKSTPIPLTYGYEPLQAANPGVATVKAYIAQVFGPDATAALAVAQCESGYDPNARNSTPIGQSHAMGVFQFLFPDTWEEMPERGVTPYDYKANIQAAHDLFSRDGNSWREWECQP